MTYKIVILGSTGGSVLSQLGAQPFIRDATLEVVTDRLCGMLEVAARLGMKAITLPANDGGEFSQALLSRYGARDDLIFLSFYTRLLRGELLKRFRGRIFNCHPSLLPAFKGMHGFEDTLASSSPFMGCTLHQVDCGMDTGPILIQAAFPLDRRRPVAQNRHQLFQAQVYTSMQFCRWVHLGRLKVHSDGSWSVDDLHFEISPIVPNLDPDFFEVTGLQDIMGLSRRFLP